MLRQGVRLAQFGRRRVASSGYSCNLTIGADSGLYGYSVPIGFGSISAEPVPGHVLDAVVWVSDGSYIGVAFSTNCLTLVTALNAYVNGVNYGGAGSWAWDGSHTAFEAFSGPTLTSGTYLFEIK